MRRPGSLPGLLALNAAVVVAYVTAAAVGFRLAFVAEQITTVWAPTGIALAALLMGGLRLWPAIWVGALLANVGTSAPLWTALVIASGNTLEAVAGVWLLRRIPQFEFGFRRVSGVLAFIAIAAVSCTAISATVGVVTLCAAAVQSWERFPALWFDWWLGDALGAMVVAPAILTALSHAWSRRDWARASIWVAGSIAVTQVLFGQQLGTSQHPFEYAAFPLVIAAALVGGPSLTSLVVLSGSVVTIWHTVHGSGPFATPEVHHSLILLQAFTFILAGTSLLLAAAIAERRMTEHRQRDAADELRQAEAALLESRDVLSLAMRGGSMGAWSRNLTTNEVWWSRELEGIFGLEPGAFSRTNDGFFEFVHEDDRQTVRTAVDEALRNHSDYIVDFRFRHASGEWRWMEGRGRAVYDSDRQPRTLYGIGIDVTRRKRAEIALQQAKAAAEAGQHRLADANRDLARQVLEQQTLLDVLPIGIGIATDRTCQHIRTNRAFAQTLGLSPDTNASKTAPRDERPTHFRILTPAGVEVPDDALPMQVAAREGREVRDAELDVVHDDGRVVRLLEYAAPLLDEHGTPRGAVGAFVDVTAAHQARETLARSAARFRRIFETVGVSLWEEDFSAVKAALDRLRDDGVQDLAAYLTAHPEFVDHAVTLVKVVDVNEATLRMFGAVNKDALIQSLGRIFRPETRDVFAGELLALAEGRRQFESEAALQTLDGRPLDVLVTLAFPGAGESLDSVLVSLADITDRKQAENALRRSETLFREMADTAPVMLWITDRDGQCTFLSRSWYEFTGQSKEEALGLGWTLAVHPDDREPAAATFLTANERQESFRLEYRLRDRDGSYRWAIDSARPRFDEGGVFAGFIGAVIDITDRKQAETALRQEVEVRTTLAQVGAALAGELKSDALIQAVTDASIRLTEAEFGAFFHNVTNDHGDSIVRLDDVTKDPDYGHQPPHAMSEGHQGVRSYLAVPVIGRNGVVLGGLFFGHSQPGVFTERHELLASGVAGWASIALDNARLYRDAEEANRLKDEFLATLSHELRTPLNAVLGWAHMLREGSMQPSMRQRALESLERNAKVQAQLVEDLLDVSRIMAGKLQLKADAVELRAVITNAVDTVRAGVTAKRLALHLHLPADRRLLVTGDADRLQQVVWNLVSNAVKFTPSGGRVDVELSDVESKAAIVVRDTGPGIDPAFRAHLFERFRQMDASKTRAHGGLGLGLSIVRHLVEAHGGTVEAESEGPGRGATFRVMLPLRAIDDVPPDAPRPPAVARDRTLAGVRALVVDDEDDARDLTRFVLESSGAAVVTTNSAGEALHLLSRDRFAIVIADIGMPEQDGLSLIRAIRGLPLGSLNRDVPALAVTAYAAARDRDDALAAGFNGHFGKPVDPEELVAIISTITARHPEP